LVVEGEGSEQFAGGGVDDADVAVVSPAMVAISSNDAAVGWDTPGPAIEETKSCRFAMKR